MTAVLPADTASVVVPAHNEGVVIERCLDALLADARPGEFEVVVVCNACTDDTAIRAAAYPGVVVRELAAPGKVGALNVGDLAVRTMPRIYLDADVVLDTASARTLVAAAREGASVAAPRPRLDLRGTPLLVRAYFAIWTRLGVIAGTGLGSGVYTLSTSARARFTEFPDVIGDDTFILRSFAASERVSPAGAWSTVTPPRTLRALVRRRARVVRGNVGVAASFGPLTAVAPTWEQLVRRRPWLLPAAAVYVAVNAVAHAVAMLPRNRSVATQWTPDTTSRQAR